jgi:protein kinase
MQKYRIIKTLGDGTFGSVYKAINKLTHEIVAIKKMKKDFPSWEECAELKEVTSLIRLSHPNIVKLKEVIREKQQLFFVFEHMDVNLYQLMTEREKPFPEVVIRNIVFYCYILNINSS